MKLALLSDIHLYRKPQRLRCALQAAEGAQVLLSVVVLQNKCFDPLVEEQVQHRDQR